MYKIQLFIFDCKSNKLTYSWEKAKNKQNEEKLKKIASFIFEQEKATEKRIEDESYALHYVTLSLDAFICPVG